MTDAPRVFDDAETREETRATVAEMDLEIVTERIVRDEVARRLRARYPARASFDVSRDVVSSEIDAFLRGLGDVETETHKRARDDDDDGETAGAATTTSSPTLARIHKQRRVEDSDEDVTARVRRALGALGAEGGDAKSIAGFLKIDKSAANKALYALRARGEATADASSGGAPRWTASGGGASETVPVRTAAVAPPAVKAETPTEPETEAVENQVVALAPNKRVTVRKWNNSTLVDIREYYQTGGEGPYKPGKKGISLSTAQWRALRERLGDVAAAVEACRASGAETTVCEMSNTRRCSVSKFKGRVFVNVREYYEKDGRFLPGAKGAALSAEAAAILVANAEKIDERVRQLGG